MLGFPGETAERRKNIPLRNGRRVFHVFALGQARRHASARQGSTASIGGKREVYNFSILYVQPEFHRIAARAGDARMPVEFLQPSMMARVLRVVSRRRGKFFHIHAFHFFVRSS
jgi:hypothetical protein